MRSLPSPAPADPVPLVTRWLDEVTSSGALRNPNAMALATAGARGAPSVRMVLLKQLAPAGYAVFYTNYESRKGREIEANASAAAVLYWEPLGLQVRFEGPVVRSPSEESDAYFATRPFRSQLNAWASRQSQPLADPRDLDAAAERVAREHGLPPEGASAGGLPRPARWGGYRLWFETVEIWAEGAHRFHERLRYHRALERADPFSFRATAWAVERLQP